MAIKASKLGPGVLTLGETGTTTEFGSQCTKIQIDPETKDGEIIAVLSGEELVDGADDTYKLTGEFLQDYSVEGLVLWTWTHHGEQMPYTFTPNSAEALTMTGQCIIRRVMIGGDVKKRNTSPFEFVGVGEPVPVTT